MSNLIVLVAVAAGFLTLVCLAMALTSPRVFANSRRRVLAAIGFGLYTFVLFDEARIFSLAADASVSFAIFIKWCAMIIMPAMCFHLMRKLERARRDKPMKHDRFASAIDRIAGRLVREH